MRTPWRCVLTGTKSEIAESVSRMHGHVREAIVFVNERAEEDIFAEMEPLTVRADGVDYSRQSLCTPMEGE